MEFAPRRSSGRVQKLKEKREEEEKKMAIEIVEQEKRRQLEEEKKKKKKEEESVAAEKTERFVILCLTYLRMHLLVLCNSELFDLMMISVRSDSELLLLSFY